MYGENDGSHVRYFVQRYCPHFHDLRTPQTAHDQDAALYVAQQAMDIAVDLTSHTYNGRLAIACYRPAPLVINYLGFAGTTGCAQFDYTMVDRYIAAPDYQHTTAATATATPSTRALVGSGTGTGTSTATAASRGPGDPIAIAIAITIV
eukprot:gene21018-25808_t